MKIPPTQHIIVVLSNYGHRYKAVELSYRVMSKSSLYQSAIHQSAYHISKRRTNPYAHVIVLG